MKKFSLLFLFMSAALVSQAQVDLRAFVGFNTLQLSTEKSSSMIDGKVFDRSVIGRLGAQSGFAITFGKQFFVQPGISWNSFSFEEHNENAISGEKYIDRTILTAISVPLRVGVRVIPPSVENMVNIRVFGGIIGNHVTGVNHKEKSGKVADIDKTDFTNMIINADFGMGLDLFIFFVDAGYQMGLTPVFRQGDKSKANAFYLNGGLRIRL